MQFFLRNVSASSFDEYGEEMVHGEANLHDTLLYIKHYKIQFSNKDGYKLLSATLSGQYELPLIINKEVHLSRLPSVGQMNIDTAIACN